MSQLHVVARSDVIHEPPAGDSDVIQREFRWRRHPLLRVQTGAEDDAASMTLDLRTARSAAVRGIFFARSRRFSKAEASFADAAVHPQINLTAIPGFWDLSRAGMDAAICAYEANGRYRDAAALTARIRVMYRPTAVTPLPPLNENRRSASGS